MEGTSIADREKHGAMETTLFAAGIDDAFVDVTGGKCDRRVSPERDADRPVSDRGGASEAAAAEPSKAGLQAEALKHGGTFLPCMPDFTELKKKHKDMWAMGEYDQVAHGLHSAQDHVIRAARPRPGERVLDVATGTGNTAIKARAMGASVTGFDLTPELLAVARKKAEGLGFNDIRWDEGDAAKLPYRDGEFDVVLSTCGHMFAPDQEQVGAEMARVTRPGGRIVFMAWTQESGVGRLFQVMAKHAPPPPNVPSTFSWADEQRVRALLGSSVTDLRFERGDCVDVQRDAKSLTDLYATKYGPTVRALASLQGEKRDALARDLSEFFAGYVTPADGRARWGREYLLTHATKR
jgi:ubiquinone/menaquinone biosynthesis C-methylase UbiE